MRSLNLLGGEKGGVGKSVTARVLAQYFIDKGRPFTGFDTDRSHTSFTRFYADQASHIVVDKYEGLDLIANMFDEGTASVDRKSAIVDLAAQTAVSMSMELLPWERLRQSRLM
jgi:cellulose biosynthesis protein BcsQ